MEQEKNSKKTTDSKWSLLSDLSQIASFFLAIILAFFYFKDRENFKANKMEVVSNNSTSISYIAIFLIVAIAYFMFITIVKSWIHKKQLLKHKEEIELLTGSIKCLLENARLKSPVQKNGGSYSYEPDRFYENLKITMNNKWKDEKKAADIEKITSNYLSQVAT